MTQEKTEHRAGFVNLIGNPNVGKSTLMNQLVGERLSIITAKAQTTRHRIKGIVDGDNFQIIYSDLPGILTPAYKMQEMMMKFVGESLQDADLILYLVECGETQYNEQVIAKLQKIDTPILLVFNKIDKVTPEQIEMTERHWTALLPQAESIRISALQGLNLDVLLKKIIEKLPVSPPYFPKDQLTDRPMRFFVSEIIREKILLLYNKEIPYSVEVVEEEMQDEEGFETAEIPLNQPGKDILYTLNPREPKFFPLSIAAAAKIFHAAGESWTLSTKMYDVTNYGFFSGNDAEATLIAKNMYDEVEKLGCKTLVLGECGHGTRALRWESPNFLHHTPDFEMTTLAELLEKYIKTGRIKLDKSLNTKKYTIHDPCNITRNGGLFNTLRFVVKSAVPELIEMDPYGNDNFCCGGGGGMLAMSEYNERRLKVGKIKADQIAATGADVVITPCHNCVDQLMQIDHHYKLGVEIKSVAEVVADALVMG